MTKGLLPINLEDFIYSTKKHIDFSVSVREAFHGWENIDSYLETGNYFVIFESKRKEGPIISILLFLADYFAHKEAKKMPGFRGYYRGQLDSTTRKCRSFCIWDKRECAVKSGKQPHHKKAMLLTKFAYYSYEVKRYIVTKRNGVIRLEKFSQPNNYDEK